jgi:hypothetical protein
MDFGRSPEYGTGTLNQLETRARAHFILSKLARLTHISAGRSNAQYMYLAIPGILTSDSLNLSIPSDDQSAARRY